TKEKIDIKNLPTHIGLIPDGNRRWAKMNNLPYEVGYRKGIENLINFISWIGELKIKYLTVWAFSTENWLRSKDEKELLFELLKQKAEELLKNKDFDKYQIKITFRGEVEKFDKEILEVIDKIQNKTKNFNKYHLTFMLNYGGRKEILEAVKKIARDVKNNKVKEDEIDEALFSKYLLTNDLPDPDLIIRTAEKRLSGFLPWQSVYSELYFSEKLWPDFRKEDLIKALMDYSERERRFGK
ncbi:MAG: polyprenyl diphosphate synthase, partial [Candidatus Micrarchaeota archaeon]|nr:polyprenyl diphosphate synthase [Candidatus Micrarchaeota archaeon]